VARLAEADLPTRHGTFRIAVFQVDGAPLEATALFAGTDDGSPPLVRLHSECLTGDSLGSLKCDCGEQLDAALDLISRAPFGILFYLRQEGRGIGLANKIRAYALQDAGLDTVDANVALGLPVDVREYGAVADILLSIRVSRIRLLTNNPDKATALERGGIEIVERVPLIVQSNPNNDGYLRAKAERMGHLIGTEPAPG
jgi:GTP cyclohydrolase II